MSTVGQTPQPLISRVEDEMSEADSGANTMEGLPANMIRSKKESCLMASREQNMETLTVAKLISGLQNVMSFAVPARKEWENLVHSVGSETAETIFIDVENAVKLAKQETFKIQLELEQLRIKNEQLTEEKMKLQCTVNIKCQEINSLTEEREKLQNELKGVQKELRKLNEENNGLKAKLESEEMKLLTLAEQTNFQSDDLQLQMNDTEQANVATTLKERRREKELLKAQEILLRRQRSGEASESDEERADAVRGAISFRSRQDTELAPAPVLQKAKEFRQADGVVTPPPTSDEPVPDLPSAPPSEMSGKNPISKKEHMSPPQSPIQKHLEHVKSDDKKKRTPSFNLRNRSRSFKDKHQLPENLPAAAMEGLLERKQELQSGGTKATIHSWKNYYAVLFGQLLCFFQDKKGYSEKFAVVPPVTVHQARCEVASDYTKKKFVLRLRLHDGAEFLLEAPSHTEMLDWVSHINRFAVQSAMFPDMEFSHFEEEEDRDQPPSIDSTSVPDGQQHSRVSDRSVSPTEEPRVETIPKAESRTLQASPPPATRPVPSPRKQEQERHKQQSPVNNDNNGRAIQEEEAVSYPSEPKELEEKKLLPLEEQTIPQSDGMQLQMNDTKQGNVATSLKESEEKKLLPLAEQTSLQSDGIQLQMNDTKQANVATSLKNDINGGSSFGEMVKYPLSQLQLERVPEGVDPKCKEMYLSPEEFKATFRMTYSEFLAKPVWKQQTLKKSAKLF